MMPFSEIGRGSQFKAYDMRNGRVLKIPLTEAESYYAAKHRLLLPSATLDDLARLDVRVQTLMNGKARIPSMITHSFRDKETFLGLMGNPALIDGGNFLPEDTPEKRWGPARFIYTQDQVEMTGPVLDAMAMLPRLQSGDKKRIARIMEEYVQTVYRLWEFGYSDYVFKLGDTGFDSRGKFVIVDLGEMSGDYSFLVRTLAEQRWRGAVNPKKKDFPQIPLELYDKYIPLMENALSVKELKKRWHKKHTCNECKETEGLKDFISAKVSEIDFIDRW